MADDIQEIAKRTKELREQTEAAIESRQLLLDLIGDESKKVAELLAIRKKLDAAIEAGADNVEELRQKHSELAQQLSDQAKEVVNLTEALANQQEELKRAQKALDEYIEKIEKSEKVLAGIERGFSKVRGSIDKLTSSTLGSTFTLDGFVNNIISVAHRLQDLEVGLARSTGRVTDFRDNLQDITRANKALSISLTEGKEIISGLSVGMTRFNLVGEKQQRVLQNVAARFKRLGVETSDFAPVLDRINFGFGMTGEAAASAAASLEDMSDEVGRPLQSVIQDLNEIGPTLARFGNNGLKVFRKLNIQARELGLTVKQAFDLTELFDTFESAANVAGRLNAQLGLQLNSVEIMKASTEDRLDILRKEFQLQGKNFQAMGRRQKQMIASILGVDEETAAKALGEGMDISQFQKQKAKEKTLTDVVTFQEQTTRAIEALGQELAPLFQKLIQKVLDLTRNFADWGPKVLVALGVGAAGSMLARGGMALSKGLATGAASGTGMLAAGTGLATAGGAALSTLSAIPLVGQAIGGIGQGLYEYQQTGDAGRAVARGGAGITGGLAGAAAGAAIGSVVPVIGTAIGGIIGGVLGQFGGGMLATSIMGDPKKDPGKSSAVNDMKRTQAQKSQSETDRTIEVKEMTLPIRMVVDGREFSPIVEKAMNIKLNPVTPR